jgi:N-methylhydantoinase A
VIKAISTIRGHDLREFLLLPFGGAGPIHAGAIADSLDMAGLVVPLYPGVFSAIGLLMSDVKHDYIRSRLTPFAVATPATINGVFGRLEAQARDDLAAEGFGADRIHIACSLDMRYAGQGYELTVPCGAVDGAEDLARLRARFDATHKQQFGHSAPDEVVEIVSWRLQSTGLVPPVEPRRFEPTGARLAAALRERRQVWFGGMSGGGFHDTPVYQRERLDVGHEIAGPAVIEQYDCTIVLEPGQHARVDAFKSLMVDRRG